MGVDTYHFSITWSKLFPNGGAEEQPDQEYESYLESLLDGLMVANVKAVVTIFSLGLNFIHHLTGIYTLKHILCWILYTALM